MEVEGVWLSITEYADYREISISTVRRHIKAGRLRSKLEGGSFFIYVPKDAYQRRLGDDTELLGLRLELQRLENRIKILEEENADLKMLVQIYESSSQPNSKPHLPELPQQ